jgi:uncharacterized membrane protein YkoI
MNTLLVRWSASLALVPLAFAPFGCSSPSGTEATGKKPEPAAAAQAKEPEESQAEEGQQEEDELDLNALAGILDQAPVQLGQALDLARKEAAGGCVVQIHLAAEEKGEAPEYQALALVGGKVKELEIDAATGKLKETEERPVHAGREDYAARLRALASAAHIDLAGAAGIAEKEAGGGRAVGVWASAEEGTLGYAVAVVAAGKTKLYSVDATSGKAAEMSMEDDEENEEEDR